MQNDENQGKFTLSPAMLNVYRIFVVCSVILVYIGSVFMTYVILSDVIFQVTHFFVDLTVLFENDDKTQSQTLNILRFISQVCWVLYSFSVVALILMIVWQQFVSFFKTMWDSLGTEQVLRKIGSILQNPNVKKRNVYALLILFAIYFIAMVVTFIIEYFAHSSIYYSAFFIILFFIPVFYGILKVLFESWRIAFLILTGRYSKYTYEPADPFPNFPFPTDLLDPAKLRDQNEFLNFIRDDRTNIYVTNGHTGRKLLGYIHIVALLIGTGIRIYCMIYDHQNTSYLGVIGIVFYLFAAPFMVFCNVFSTFLPSSAFKDERTEEQIKAAENNPLATAYERNGFDKGGLQIIFLVVILIYLLIFIILIVLSAFILTWERPEQKYNYKFYTKSSLMSANWTIAKSSATTCSIDIKGVTFSQFSALPILTYYDGTSLSSDIVNHNRKVILNMALATFRERKATEIDYDAITDGIHIKDNKLHIFVMNGLRNALDWVLLFEQFIQQGYFMALRSLIPFYNIVYSIFRVALLTSNKYFTKATFCRFLTLEKAARIKTQIKQVLKKKSWNEYTTVAVGHMTGGYFAKYLGSFVYPDSPTITGIGFDSLTFQGTSLEIENTLKDDFGMTVNVYSKGSIYSSTEERTKNNFERNKYPSFMPPDAVESFCQSVAMCSNTRFEIDFCHSVLGQEFIDLMESYDRYMTLDDRINNVGVVTNKDDYNV